MHVHTHTQAHTNSWPILTTTEARLAWARRHFPSNLGPPSGQERWGQLPPFSSPQSPGQPRISHWLEEHHFLLCSLLFLQQALAKHDMWCFRGHEDARDTTSALSGTETNLTLMWCSQCNLKAAQLSEIGKTLSFSVPQFSYLQNGNTNSTYIIEL